MALVGLLIGIENITKSRARERNLGDFLVEEKKMELVNYIVGGVGVCSLTNEQLAEKCVEDYRLNNRGLQPKLVFSMNGEGISYFNSSDKFKTLVSQADLIHPDGMSVVWAGRLFSGGAFPERVATTDAFHDVARLCEAEGLSFYFLGAKEEINSLTVQRVKELYPKLKIAGRHHGYFSDAQDEEICQKICASGADVVWVALGRPKQEEWCVNNRHRLIGVTWLKTCGGLFDFLSGTKPRAPKWMQSAGLEWLFRLCDDPRRLFKRYLYTNIHSIYCFLTKSKKH